MFTKNDTLKMCQVSFFNGMCSDYSNAMGHAWAIGNIGVHVAFDIYIFVRFLLSECFCTNLVLQ